MTILDGKTVSTEIKDKLKAEVDLLIASGGRTPHLVAVLIGNNPASETYVASKVKACERVGFKSTEYRFKSDVTESFLINQVRMLNEQPDVDGILVQMPLPDHISADKVLETIVPAKDVDGFHPVNVGRMSKNLEAILPATPAGIMELIRWYKIPTEGRHAVVVGKSNIVGMPVSILLSRDAPGGRATVTMTDIYTSKAGKLKEFTLSADILVVAAGVPNLIKADMVREGATVIDVGISRIEDPSRSKGYKIVGDVDYDAVSPKCEFITPVPGGVGPMTIAILLRNTLQTYRERNQLTTPASI